MAEQPALHDLVLEHYTPEPLVLDRDRTYDQRKPRGFGKPVGFWVSVAGEGDWPAWCRDQEFCVGSLKNCSRITLAEDANILLVSTAEQLNAFHGEFSIEEPDLPALPERDAFTIDFNRRQRPVDWSAVAERWQGVMFAPYLWSLRFDGPSFYYSLDCASGCIWDLDAIESVTPQAGATDGFPWGSKECPACGHLRTEFGKDGTCLGCEAREFMKTVDVAALLRSATPSPPEASK